MEPMTQIPGQIDALRRQISRLELRRPPDDASTISSGFGPLDRLLPGGGVARGTLIEWLAEGHGSGVEALAWRMARAACRSDGAVVVLDRDRDFYPPAAVRLGIDPRQLIVIQAAEKADHDWALDQALRCPGVDVVWARPDGPREKLDGRTFRRLQLAAEGSGCIGVLIREASMQTEPSWAELRLLVEPLSEEHPRSGSRRVRIRLLRCRGAVEGRSVDVEIDDETHAVHLVA